MSGPRTLGLRLLLAAATLSGASCSGSSSYDNTTAECQPGEQKCEGDTLLSCPAIAYAVEFTGAGAAELYGYFPSATTGKNFIARINKSTAQYDLTWQLPALAAQHNAWAFAHWGGRYYQFVTVNGQNQILRYDPTTKANIVVQSSTPYPIVGAGVSTCAPYIVG